MPVELPLLAPQKALDILAVAPQHQRGDDDGQHMGPPKWIFILRDVSTMILTAGLSAAIKLSRRWAQMDAARREAEKSRRLPCRN